MCLYTATSTSLATRTSKLLELRSNAALIMTLKADINMARKIKTEKKTKINYSLLFLPIENIIFKIIEPF